MSNNGQRPPLDRAGRTLIKAFTFAGAILGTGGFGLARATMLLARELGWMEKLPNFGAAYWWVLGGAGAGLLAGWLLVNARRRQD